MGTPADNDDPALRLEPLSPVVGVEVRGVDLSKPVDDALFRRIHEAFLRHQLLVFPGQRLSEARQIAFARRFGEVQVHVLDQFHADGHPEIYLLSNVDESGRTTGLHTDLGTLVWHTDGSWSKRPGLTTLLYALEVPKRGGDTLFANTYAAFEALSDADKARLSAMRAVHDQAYSRSRSGDPRQMSEEQNKASPPVEHPVVRTHPETGRKCIFLGEHASHIAGLPFAEGRQKVNEINDMATCPAFVYRHRWQPRQLVMWDNRCMLHQATTFDAWNERRIIRRVTVVGDAP